MGVTYTTATQRATLSRRLTIEWYSLETQLAVASVLSIMLILFAYAGRMADAVRDGERGVAMNEDAYYEPYLEQQLARIYLLSGQADKAIDLLERLVRVPHTLSAGWLRIDPTWDPLRSQPGFVRLVEGKP